MSTVRAHILAAIGAVVLLATGNAAHAKCAYYAEWLVTPAVAGPTPRIVVSIYKMGDRPTNPEFEARADDGKRFPLAVTSRHEGMNQTQFDIAPSAALAPGAYEVWRIDPPTEGERREALALTVSAPPQAPASVKAPSVRVIESRFEAFGCGPGENIVLGVDLPNEALVFITLTDAKSGEVRTGYDRVHLDDAKRATFSVGHGMCSGEFRLTSGTRYRIAVEAVAPDGTHSAVTTIDATYAPRTR